MRCFQIWKQNSLGNIQTGDIDFLLAEMMENARLKIFNKKQHFGFLAIT